jgi:hypothetical protein
MPGPFPRDKAAGHGVDHPPPSSTEFKERVEVYLYSPSAVFMAYCRVYLPFILQFRLQSSKNKSIYKHYYNFRLKIINPPASLGI